MPDTTTTEASSTTTEDTTPPGSWREVGVALLGGTAINVNVNVDLPWTVAIFVAVIGGAWFATRRGIRLPTRKSLWGTTVGQARRALGRSKALDDFSPSERNMLGRLALCPIYVGREAADKLPMPRAKDTFTRLADRGCLAGGRPADRTPGVSLSEKGKNLGDRQTDDWSAWRRRREPRRLGRFLPEGAREVAWKWDDSCIRDVIALLDEIRQTDRWWLDLSQKTARSVAARARAGADVYELWNGLVTRVSARTDRHQVGWWTWRRARQLDIPGWIPMQRAAIEWHTALGLAGPSDQVSEDDPHLERAAEGYREAIRSLPKRRSALAQMNLGVVLAHQGELIGAYNAIDQAVGKLVPNRVFGTEGERRQAWVRALLNRGAVQVAQATAYRAQQATVQVTYERVMKAALEDLERAKEELYKSRGVVADWWYPAVLYDLMRYHEVSRQPNASIVGSLYKKAFGDCWRKLSPDGKATLTRYSAGTAAIGADPE